MRRARSGCTSPPASRSDEPYSESDFCTNGPNVAGPNSGRLGPWALDRGDGFVDFVVDELLLSPASYEVSTAIVDRGHTFDYADREFPLRVRGAGDQEPGLSRMPGTWIGPVSAPSPAPQTPREREAIHARK